MKLLLLIIMLGLAACDYGIAKHQPADDDTVTMQDNQITFADVQEKVLKPACISCHDGSKNSDLRTYDKVYLARNDINVTVFVTRTMPKDQSLTASQIHLLQGWLRAGALEFGGNSPQPAPPTTDPSAPVTFQQIKTQIIEPHCMSCHSPTNTDGLSDFSTADDVQSTITSFYFSTVASDSMPPRPQGADPAKPNPLALTRDEKMLISLWILDGMQGP